MFEAERRFGKDVSRSVWSGRIRGLHTKPTFEAQGHAFVYG
jgi:hypothetical protein